MTPITIWLSGAPEFPPLAWAADATPVVVGLVFALLSVAIALVAERDRAGGAGSRQRPEVMPISNHKADLRLPDAA